MIKLTPRLQSAVAYVRPGHLFADIGTDHAYLPIALCQSGRLIPTRAADGSFLCALASDINQGPVDRATIHIATAGLADRIRTLRTDGLRGVEVYAPTDIAIFGMGGELIASILEAAPWVKDPNIRLILQPMTHPEKLRVYLAENGFYIVGETLSKEDSRIYQTVCVAFGATDALGAIGSKGKTALSAYTPAELLTGRNYPSEERALHLALIEKSVKTVTACRDAKAGAGQDTQEEEALIRDLIRLRNVQLSFCP